MKKLSLYWLGGILLQSCAYIDGCLYTPQMVNCYVDKGDSFPYIAQFQKVDSIGHTDPQKRWHDAYLCGGEHENNDLQVKGVRSKDGSINLEVLNKFENCMRAKGYHRFWPAECGYKNPKWDKGVCNE
ncbi:Uncharacterised protein [Canicola haemoglobinophilus]|uniref:Lipoprotein n=1 Tax=Canicola haemoglobinophilus TaxID=733 RepID=A0AB38HAL7_9PAST|nr:hypothetical protein [Canicola haemoglobinophilus]MBN6711955.1 hypothetical protein [Canicola haemoglobinophilus]STO55035.1 Uncharacterised protein [Canicola haemoglobinophilus]STO69394.1 Uncharacterised protein [Canicola haemoglobinophilus]